MQLIVAFISELAMYLYAVAYVHHVYVEPQRSHACVLRAGRLLEVLISGCAVSRMRAS
jgi:hypothetical protein